MPFFGVRGYGAKLFFGPITFQHDGHEQTVRATRGQGSCALHALLGEENGGVYRYAGDDRSSSARVKKHYTDTLAASLVENANIQGLFINSVRAYLNESLKPVRGGDPCAHMLFTDTAEGRYIKGRWQALQDYHHAQIEQRKSEEGELWSPLVETNQNGIFDRIMVEVLENQARGVGSYVGMDEGEVRAVLLSDPKRILDIVSSEREAFLALLSPEASGLITPAHQNLLGALQMREGDEERFILHARVKANYIATVNKPAFYFNTTEINLSAHLFNKKVQVVASRHGGVVPTELLMNAGAEGETIIIHHQGAHFSRCVRSDSIPAPQLQQGVSRRSDGTPSKTGSYQAQREAGQKIFVDFYSGRCKNLNGVSIEDILKYNRSELEAHHNFIQWLFPIQEVSRYEAGSPLATKEIILAFKSTPDMQRTLVRSLRLMLSHYGLELSESGVVQKGENFEARKGQMLGHNSDRITRILTSLTVLGKPELARSFYDCLEGLYREGNMGKAYNSSFEEYWRPAVLGSKAPLMSLSRPSVVHKKAEEEKGSPKKVRKDSGTISPRISGAQRREVLLPIDEAIRALFDEGKVLNTKKPLSTGDVALFEERLVALQKRGGEKHAMVFRTLNLFVDSLKARAL